MKRYEILSMVLIAGIVQGCAVHTPEHAGFASPTDAVSALVTAASKGDEKDLEALFGPNSSGIYSSGDRVADRNARESFLARYAEAHSIVPEGEDTARLEIGSEGWPSPIPLVRGDDGKWYFDGEAGVDEISNRRIGHNEISTIEACREIAAAQKVYWEMDPDGDGVNEYAKKLLSTPGSRDGLFWSRKPGEAPSPIGPLIATASAEGYRGDGKAGAFHGYRFKLLTQKNGQSLLSADGKLTKGFAMLAYPAKWGTSGIMSFLISDDSALLQKNLGADTESIAAQMSSFAPGSDWTVVQ